MALESYATEDPQIDAKPSAVSPSDDTMTTDPVARPADAASRKNGKKGGGARSLAASILQNAGGGDNTEEDSSDAGESESQDNNENEDGGIPGAIVALIFGVFGLLVIARRNLR